MLNQVPRFLPPKMFTNALLTTHDITSLIRDTEPHERALFSVPSTQPAYDAALTSDAPTSRRQTVFAVSSGEVTTATGPVTRAPRRNTAVAAVLGPELHSQVRRAEGAQMGKQGQVDVQVLLRGAEKLNEVYTIKGVAEQINQLRSKYSRVQGDVDKLEEKVQTQTRELERMNKGDNDNPAFGDDYDVEDHELRQEELGTMEELIVTEEVLRREEEEIRELESKKKELEDRVSGMEKDLGGLMR